MNILVIAFAPAFQKHRGDHDLIEETIKEAGYTYLSNRPFESSYGTPKNFVKRINEFKKKTDSVIVDIYEANAGIGHDIQWALANNKPTLLIYRKYEESSLSATIVGKTHKLLSKLAYAGKDDLSAGIEKFLRRAESMKLNVRFNCMLSEKHLKHLEKASRKEGLSNSAYVRRLIEADM